MAFGVKANIKQHKFLRKNACCWILMLYPANIGERLLVRGLSKGGRKVTTWVSVRRLKDFRAGWFYQDSGDIYGCAPPASSRCDAENLASMLNTLAEGK